MTKVEFQARRVGLGLASLSLFLGGADAVATEFVGNHLFISDPTNQLIRELDATGAVVRLLGGSTLVNPQRLAFGLDGNLYVLDDQGAFSTTDHLVVISADGDVLSDLSFIGASTFDAATAPAPYFTPRGTMLLVDTAQATVLEVDPATATVLTTYTDAAIAQAGGVRVTERGQLHVGVSNATHSVVAFEPDGFFVRSLGTTSLGAGSASPLLVDGPFDGMLTLLRSVSTPATARLHVLDAVGGSLAQLDLSDGPYVDLAFGPDGAIWLLAAGGTKLVRVDPALAGVTNVAYSPAPAAASGFAFAPYRLRLKAKGSFISSGDDATQIPATGYVLTYFPGAERLGVEVEVGSPATIVFGRTQFALHGVAPPSTDAETRRVQIAFAGLEGGSAVTASSSFRLTGSVSATSSYFRPKSAKGTLQLASVAGAFKADLHSVKVLE